jgi:hypothetical protein
MRLAAVVLAAAMLSPALAAAASIPCSELPKAQHFLTSLKPGPNTRAAERHLEAAKHAKSPRQCSAELRKVDFYARRSAAADHRHQH